MTAALNSQSTVAGIADYQVMTKEEKLHKERVMAKFKKLMLHPNLSDNIFNEMNVKNLKHMYEKSIKEEADIRSYFNIRNEADARVILTPPINRRVKKHELREIFEELCFTAKLQYSDVFDYFEDMRKRVTDIEKVIDHHFGLIKDSIYQSKVDAIERQNKIYDKQNEKKKPTSYNALVSVKTQKTQRSGVTSNRTGRNTAKS